MKNLQRILGNIELLKKTRMQAIADAARGKEEALTGIEELHDISGRIQKLQHGGTSLLREVEALQRRAAELDSRGLTLQRELLSLGALTNGLERSRNEVAYEQQRTKAAEVSQEFVSFQYQKSKTNLK